MTTTTVTGFKAALVSALGARDALAGVQVGYAWRGPASDPEGIYMAGHTLEAEVPNFKAGRHQRHETYQLEVVCYAIQPGSSSAPASAQAAEARAMTFVGELDSTLADDIDLSGVEGSPRIVHAYRVGSRSEDGPVPVEKGWGSVITVTVEVEARLY